MMIGRLAMVAALATAMPTLAAERSAGATRVLAPLVACRAIADAGRRATCYDAALDRLQSAVSTAQVTILDREQASADRRAAFGYSGARPPAPPPVRVRATETARVPAEDVPAIDSTVAAAAPYGVDRWTIRLVTGATWRTTEPGLSVAPKAGTPVHIKRGLMGSYMMRIGNARALRAMRVG